MTRNLTLSAAVALTLSACPLFAQDNQPTPPQRPAQPKQGDGGPHREGAPAGGQHHAPGPFGAFDLNHDGVIDAEEIAHASEVLRKLDRNGDGRITLDELQPAGGDAQHRGPHEPGASADSRRDQGPRTEGRGDSPRPEGARPDGERGPRPDGDARRDGDRPRAPMPDGQRKQGPRDGERGPGAPGVQRDGDARRDGPQRPPQGDAPQAQLREQRRAQWMQDAKNSFAQGARRPDSERGGRPAPWERGAFRSEGGPQGPMAMGPRMDARQGPARMMGREGFDPQEFRAFLNEYRSRRQQGGQEQSRALGAGADRPGPGMMQRPNFNGPNRGPQPQGPGGMQRPEGMRGDRGPQGPRGEGDFRPQGPRPPDVQ